MITKARLKFYNLSLPNEYKLINEGGFVVHSRKRIADSNGPIWVMMDKFVENPSRNFEVLYRGELPSSVQFHLKRRCESVVSLFEDPDANQPEIRGRLERIAATLPKWRSEFVKKWIKENLDDAPWEDDPPGTVLKRSSV